MDNLTLTYNNITKVSCAPELSTSALALLHLLDYSPSLHPWCEPLETGMPFTCTVILTSHCFIFCIADTYMHWFVRMWCDGPRA